MRQPRVSIITPCLNRREFIGEAVESVLRQRVDAVEHIIVDGGSTDGTLDVLARYPQLRVVSGTDNGLYDALNKGLALSRGEYIGFLNSDDMYTPDALAAAVSAFDGDPQADIVSGGAELFATVGSRMVSLGVIDDDRVKRLRPIDIIRGISIINARFFRSRVFAAIGRFDTRWRIAADYDFLMRAIYGIPSRKILDRIVYRYRFHPGSLTLRQSVYNPKLGLENLSLAEIRLGHPSNPHDNTVPRIAYHNWYAWSAGRLVAHHLLGLDVGITLALLRRTLRVAPLWPIRFLGVALGQCLRADGRPVRWTQRKIEVVGRVFL